MRAASRREEGLPRAGGRAVQFVCIWRVVRFSADNWIDRAWPTVKGNMLYALI